MEGKAEILLAMRAVVVRLEMSKALDSANTGSFLCRTNASRKGSPTGIQLLPR